MKWYVCEGAAEGLTVVGKGGGRASEKKHAGPGRLTRSVKVATTVRPTTGADEGGAQGEIDALGIRASLK